MSVGVVSWRTRAAENLYSLCLGRSLDLPFAPQLTHLKRLLVSCIGIEDISRH